MDKLADNINASFQGVSADMTALTPHESFTVGNSYYVPDIYIISVTQVEKQLMNTQVNVLQVWHRCALLSGVAQVCNWCATGVYAHLCHTEK